MSLVNSQIGVKPSSRLLRGLEVVWFHNPGDIIGDRKASGVTIGYRGIKNPLEAFVSLGGSGVI
ncbi:hypothetical protein [Nostoc sp.]|uniref:hypothetical protein n=1 Tax=Nostoc sp. TaxID=1180 RepID=UPI002FFD19C1